MVIWGSKVKNSQQFFKAAGSTPIKIKGKWAFLWKTDFQPNRF